MNQFYFLQWDKSKQEKDVLSVHIALFSNLSCSKAENICNGENDLRNEIGVGEGGCSTAISLILAKPGGILCRSWGAMLGTGRKWEFHRRTAPGEKIIASSSPTLLTCPLGKGNMSYKINHHNQERGGRYYLSVQLELILEWFVGKDALGSSVPLPCWCGHRCGDGNLREPL